MPVTTRTRFRYRGAAVAGAALILLAPAVPAAAASPAAPGDQHPGKSHGTAELRLATFNASLNRATEGELSADLSTPDDAQAAAVAEVIQRAHPDIVLVNEFDYVADGSALRDFRKNYLEVPHNGAPGIRYPYAFTAPVNTGVPSGMDLNNDGSIGGGDDAYGFGLFPGQYGLAVFSKYPIDTRSVRTFQKFLWRDMPGALLPDDPATAAPADWYSPDELAKFRLSSKSHWDLPVKIGRETLHVLVSHPTPPSFDGAEDRNGTRNHDEIRFWADYIGAPGRARYIYDDAGRHGGIARGADFVIMGDQNSDPLDGDSVPGAIQQLIDNPRLTDPKPTSTGAPEAAVLQGGVNATQKSNPIYDTADFSDVPSPGNLRADYVLPSKSLRVKDSAVFWPQRSDPLSRLTGEYPFPTSDHRLVWVDVQQRGHGR
ncbi:endonuclease/exonuclease/phosphatase family protein [Nakamurella lactea]|uniref:endonuclease/exonuclease/phosphatase family protein n=1 Tax=Nakamurella lactea TaxID=459515 RepID=UPI00041FFC0C|nr:endonuclease/exonuclease/phosphatase family protein [Nakamurella lactea]